MIARCLGKFLRHNRSLQYLDVEHTGLSQKILLLLIKHITRSKSLLSLHLGYNPGIDEQMIRLIRNKMRCKKRPKFTLGLEIKKDEEFVNNSPHL